MKIALGVSGGIAAYKAAEIARLLQDRGIQVQVVMTRAAQEFIRPLTFAALTGEKVITDLFGSRAEQPNLDSAVEHIAVAQSNDALLVAPATADLLARFAHGVANDFLTTLYLATTAPVVVAPAMNVNMWNHAATQANLETLRARGVRIVEPGSGYLACGMTGPGRLAENELIVNALLEVLGVSQDLAGQTLLVTAGPTREKIDPVRYLTNRSSGRMGYAIAEAAVRRGARVLLVSGPVGQHGIAIMSVREGLEFGTVVSSDTAALGGLVAAMLAAVPGGVHALRDPTRGGVAASLNELAAEAGVGVQLVERDIPVPEAVAAGCSLLGLDPLYVANEGRLIAMVDAAAADQLLEVMRSLPEGQGACRIGTVVAEHPGVLVVRTGIGGTRIVDLPLGEQLPRIC